MAAIDFAGVDEGQFLRGLVPEDAVEREAEGSEGVDEGPVAGER